MIGVFSLIKKVKKKVACTEGAKEAPLEEHLGVRTEGVAPLEPVSCIACIEIKQESDGDKEQSNKTNQEVCANMSP